MRGSRRAAGVRGGIALAAALLLTLPALAEPAPAIARAADTSRLASIRVAEDPQLPGEQDPGEPGDPSDPAQPAPNPGESPPSEAPEQDPGSGANGSDAADAQETPDVSETPGATEPSAPQTDAPAPDDEPRGPNGGLASNSPGPERQQQPTEAQLRAFSNAAQQRALIGDDYPQKYKNLPMEPVQWDEWNFAHRQCTSFVAWRLNQVNGVKFSNQYLGLTRWGNAADWAASARSVGILVDQTPEVGAVAWSGPGYQGASAYGHVAWVADVLADGRVVIEEYNFGWAGAYHTRTVRANEFQGYIHIRDLTSAFAKTSNPTIGGAAMVGGTLTASVSGWSPAPTSLQYRWFRDGAQISGASAKTYQPTIADLGAKITVEATGGAPRYRPTSKTSAATATVLMADTNGNGIDDTQEMLPWNSDVNGDGLPDAVGFAKAGVQVSLATKSGLGAAKQWVTGFGTADGWSPRFHPRTLVDVNGDGRSDVVGFASDGVYVATSTGSGFSASSRWASGFGTAAGWSVEHHPRTLADVTGDGLPDIVGFASDGVYVAVGTGKGFKAASKWYAGFGTAKGWWVDQNPRWLADMNGDGRADIVGISNAGVHVALSTGAGFSPATRWAQDFNYGKGWRAQSHPRMLADVSGDGLPDVVGFASDGVYAAVNTGSGLRAMSRWHTGFGTQQSWQVGKHPRALADVNGDGRADVVGFGSSGTSVALSTGSGFGTATIWSREFGADGWRLDRHPRMVTDANGDGMADVVGFADGGVRIALSSGGSFAGSRLALAGLGYAAGSWRVDSHPRGFGILTLSKRPAPTISGQVRVGEKLTGATGTWQPRPVALGTQWLLDGKAIAGATGRSYTLQAGDVGKSISFRVTGSKPGHATARAASQAFAVAPGELAAATPKVTGQAKPGSTLTASSGSWGPGPVALSYQWQRNGSPIRGATNPAYQVTEADAAHRISVTVTGKKTAYRTVSKSSAQLRVAGAPKTPAASPFADVSKQHKFYREIAWMYTSGLSTGVAQPSGKPKYAPKDRVSREAMAAFLFRLAAPKDYRAPAASPFVDVPTSHKFYREIAWMRESGLSTGIKTARGVVYGPKVAVSREAMAAFLYRLERPAYAAPAASPFADMRRGDKFYREIAWMHDSGLSTGVAQPSGTPVYAPKDRVSREAMAAFLYRLETSG